MIAQFLASDAGLALQGLLIVAFADFATGTFAAIRDGTFALDAVAAFIRKHIVGRVFGIALLLILAYFGGPAGTVFMVGAIAAGAAYVAETVASVWGNIKPPALSTLKATNPNAAVNPVPVD